MPLFPLSPNGGEGEVFFSEQKERELMYQLLVYVKRASLFVKTKSYTAAFPLTLTPIG